MSELSKRCPQCGAPLASDAPQGLCPRCLLAGAAFSTDAGIGPHGTKIIPPPLGIEAVRAAFPQLDVLELIGRGGMGVVYKARQKSLNRLVALKLLAPERVNDAKFAERFSHEAQALAKLSHPHIVTIHDFGVAPPPQLPTAISHLPFYYLLMEFVDGVNLRQAMKAGRFTPEQALAIVPPVCEALQFAHERGIVHRDIKPENLLLDKDGRVKIADFGIAKMLGAATSLPPGAGAEVPTASGMPPLPTNASAAGTPQYMAPEQKDHRATDHRADIYSLGVVLYELLTGELPGAKLQPPSRKVQIDVRLDEIVLRALEVKPELRYATAAEFRTQVETAMSSGCREREPHDKEPEHVASSLRALDRGLAGGILMLLALIVPLGLLALALWKETDSISKGSNNVLFGIPPLLVLALFPIAGFLLWRFLSPSKPHGQGIRSIRREEADAKGFSAGSGGGVATVVKCRTCSGTESFSAVFGVQFSASHADRRILHWCPKCRWFRLGEILTVPASGQVGSDASARADGGAIPASSARVQLASLVTLFYSVVAAIVVLGWARIGAMETLLVGAVAGAVLWKMNLLPRFTHTAFRRGLACFGFVLSLPALAMGGFFLTQLLAESGGWRPGPAEVVLVPLIWLGMLLLPWAGMILWHAARNQAQPPHCATRTPKSEMDQDLPASPALKRLWHAPAFVLVLLYGALLVLLFSTVPDMPQRVAIHFNAEGEADNWAGRTTHALFIAGLPLLITALFAGLAALTTRFPKLLNIPRRDYWLAPERLRFTAALMLRWLLWLACLITIFFGALHWIVLLANQTQPAKLSMSHLLPLVMHFLIACMIWTASLLMRFAETERYTASLLARLNRPIPHLWKKRTASVALAVIIALVLRTWFVGAYTIKTDALAPELPAGSMVLAWKLTRAYSPGDLIVYRIEEFNSVGRVTGMEPDAVQVNRNGTADFRVARSAIQGRVFSVVWRGTRVREAKAVELTWSPTLTPGAKPDLQQILSEAQNLTSRGRYEESLQRHLWFHQHASEIDPAYKAVRLSFALSDWTELARRYPKAKQALIEIRDHKTRELAAGRGHFDLFMDVASINQHLQEEAATLALFKLIEQSDPQLARQCANVMEAGSNSIPQLRFVAWQDEVAAGAIFRPDGTSVKDAQTLQLIKSLPYTTAGGAAIASDERYLNLWFSHPHIDAATWRRLTLFTEGDKPIAVSAGLLVASVIESAGTSSPDGWIVFAVSPGGSINLNAGKLLARLEYGVGLWTELRHVIRPDFQGAMTIGHTTYLSAVGQNAKGEAFVTLTRDFTKTSEMQYDVFAITKSGQRVEARGGGRNGPETQLAESFTFQQSLSDIESFRVRTRSIRSADFQLSLPQ